VLFGSVLSRGGVICQGGDAVEFGKGNSEKRCVTPCRLVVENLEKEGRLEMCAGGVEVSDVRSAVVFGTGEVMPCSLVFWNKRRGRGNG
jgi:hypothetical protein